MAEIAGHQTGQTGRATAIDMVLEPYADASVGVVVHRDGAILGVNPAFVRIFAAPDRETVVTMRVLDFVAPEARSRVAALITTPTDDPVLHDCLRLDGVPLMVRGEGSTVEVDGLPARLTLLTPLTDDGRTEDRLHESSELFRMAFEHAAIGKALVSPEGRILYVNPALCELLGRPAEELLGLPYDAMSHPDDRELGLPYAISLLEGKADTYSIEKRYLHADGRVIWVAAVVALVRTRDGAPRYFIAQVQDVTASREAQDALHEETARLRLMQAVAEAANSTEDPDAAYAMALAAVCEHAGWPLAHVYRTSATDDRLELSELWHFQDRDRDFSAFVAATAQTTLSVGMGLPGITVATRRPTWIATSSSAFARSEAAGAIGLRSAVALPVFADGEIVAVLEFFSFTDTPPADALLEVLGHVGTQIGRVAERAHAHAQAAALDEARSRFVANAAHELRTPLATLRTIAGLLGSRRADMSEADIAECCELLERQGANLDALVDDLLDLSRLQQAVRADALRSVSVDEWVDRALDVALPPDGTTVTRSLDSGLCVIADPDRLNRALVNLLANAYRHGGPRVTLRAERDGTSVVVVVEDDGDGVPDVLVPDLFEPFSRSDTSEGTGLGLAITRALVEQAGGSVAYQGSSDQGARFVLRFEACG